MMYQHCMLLHVFLYLFDVCLLFCLVVSSPELKTQASFSDCLSSVCPSVYFSHFLLLQNHWTNFNKTWHKASLGEGYSSLFK